MRIVALVLALLLITPAAHAGNWAVTYVDPTPSFEADRSYTVGYWVLQHGNHPYGGDLGKTGFRFVGGGKPYEFTGVALRETAHYAVAFTLPAGRYRVLAIQGPFADHEVGTLTVPGTLSVKPVEHYKPWEGAAKTWVDIKPPVPAVASPEPAAVTTPVDPPRQELPIWIVATVLLGAGGVFWLVRRLRKV
ncbi:hypothetical protein Lesp02_66690 [Lentzea sp. NBRC 105346]|uniref:hypothetical protein n=1 Tax=Lentzea sp. NBRC 105346 TaxID=3032205 RepID=UPI0024A5E1F9|nr:hypothetical protein [Lentzea sp. NBRC 105346]GLZ34482.1 hypothetical protein Lesp02_66690 [Lentzea sp. NBRC 105346]